MNKEEEILLAELIVKVSAIEKLLIRSKVFTEKDLVDEITKISKDLIKFAQDYVKDHNN